MDWAGTWFPIMERLGESTEFYFAKLDAQGRPTWRTMQHTEFDGVAAMTYLLHGPEVSPSHMRSRETRAPGAIKTLVALWRHHRLIHKQRTHWRAQTYNPKPVGRAPAIAWATFSRDETAALHAEARARSVSFNAFALWALDQAVRARYVEGGDTRWVIQVNMRGAVGLGDEIPNQFSAVHIVCPPGATPATVHSLTRESLGRGSHWANWALMNIAKHVGLEKAEKFFTERYADPRPATGSYSSLGEWTTHEVGPDEAWIVGATTSKLNPIAVCPIVVNGKLAVTLQIHPTLGATEADTRALLGAWVGAFHRAPLPIHSVDTAQIVADAEIATRAARAVI